jgi:hypothetical protein
LNVLLKFRLCSSTPAPKRHCKTHGHHENKSLKGIEKKTLPKKETVRTQDKRATFATDKLCVAFQNLVYLISHSSMVTMNRELSLIKSPYLDPCLLTSATHNLARVICSGFPKGRSALGLGFQKGAARPFAGKR